MSLAANNASPDPSSQATQPQAETVVDPAPTTGANSSDPQSSTASAVEQTATEAGEGAGDHQGPQGSTSAALEDDAPAEEPNGGVVVKKKRKKAGTSMPKSRGTGFEGTDCTPKYFSSQNTNAWLRTEFYADPPMTPEEANEEQAIYSE